MLATGIGFIVGMALFGSVTLLPVYFQVVKGLDPTSAGLHMTPMMLGVFVTSIISGQIISRIGRYRIFPDHRHGADDAGADAACRSIEVETPPWLASTYMLVLGAGLGMVMQILVMAVQNAVAYEQLGVATSGTTLFRSIGGTIGAALFGGIFAYRARSPHARRFAGSLATRCAIPPRSGRSPSRCVRPISASSSTPCTRCSSPRRRLAFMAFLMALAIKEVPLRACIAPEPVGDAFQMPRDATSLEELERIVERITAHENRWLVYQRAASRIGIALEPDELWLLARIGEAKGRSSQDRAGERLRIGDAQCVALLGRLVAAGMAIGIRRRRRSRSATGAAPTISASCASASRTSRTCSPTGSPTSTRTCVR